MLWCVPATLRSFTGVLVRPGHMCAAVNRQSAAVWETDPSSRTHSSLGYQNKNPHQNKNKKKENCACRNSSSPQNRLNLQ